MKVVVVSSAYQVCPLPCDVTNSHSIWMRPPHGLLRLKYAEILSPPLPPLVFPHDRKLPVEDNQLSICETNC